MSEYEEKVQQGATILILLGLLLIIVGLYVAFALPYTIYSTFDHYSSSVTMVGHPAGWAAESAGWIFLIIGGVAASKKSRAC